MDTPTSGAAVAESIDQHLAETLTVVLGVGPLSEQPIEILEADDDSCQSAALELGPEVACPVVQLLRSLRPTSQDVAEERAAGVVRLRRGTALGEERHGDGDGSPLERRRVDLVEALAELEHVNPAPLVIEEPHPFTPAEQGSCLVGCSALVWESRVRLPRAEDLLDLVAGGIGVGVAELDDLMGCVLEDHRVPHETGETLEDGPNCSPRSTIAVKSREDRLDLS